MEIDCYLFVCKGEEVIHCNLPSCTITGKCRFSPNFTKKDELKVAEAHRETLNKAREEKYKQADHVLTFGE